MPTSPISVEVIGPTSPMVDAIVAKHIVQIGGRSAPLTSGQRLQSDRALVAKVLNACFWAGLAHEEGRSVCSGVTFSSPDDAPDQFRLLEPEPVTKENLVRLGTVCGTARKLGIHEWNGQPYIWGFLRGYAPFWTTVWFDRPARLRVMMENAGVLCLLEGGRVLVPEGHAIANPWNLSVQLSRIFPGIVPRVVQGITFIANEMSRHGHGGALLVVPSDEKAWDAHLKFSLRFSDAARTLLPRIQRGVSQISATDQAVEAALRDELIRAAGLVADMTKIDGAAVVTTDLEVLGFGARITSADPPEPIKLVSRTIFDEEFSHTAWTELGGTRHQSAARFVAATKAAAFVASHDGGLSAMACQDDGGGTRVEWLRGLEAMVAPR